MKRLLGILVFAVVTICAVPAQATCTTELLPGTLCWELFYDVHFAQSCSAWVFSGDGATKVQGADDYAQLENSLVSSYFEQTIDVINAPNGGDDLSLGFNVTMLGSSPGTERLVVEIRNTSNTVLATVASINPTSGSGRYDFPLSSSYVGQTIKVRFRYVRNASPGDTVFRIPYAQFFTCG